MPMDVIQKRLSYACVLVKSPAGPILTIIASKKAFKITYCVEKISLTSTASSSGLGNWTLKDSAFIVVSQPCPRHLSDCGLEAATIEKGT